MRLHAPLAEVVIVRVAGTLDEHSTALLAQRVGPQFERAAHVVLDLSEVNLRRCGVRLLLDLHRHAITRGARLHIADDECGAAAALLCAAGLDRVLDLVSSVDALVALIAPRPC
ncbi:STAS domain-containing protein [Pseudonocardia parietis]|uniref:Anti-anti-sigma factor n=1 Tax=Pseudonocardia parietis TaxID=570936 RepID=A0ABS4VMK5_9PSEU|nr:STAS domain-containing protein [Pseudonocardia parietis]MBP2365159.1 anti-anti-sigma factor [Pseudonocardia parietis]